MSINLQEYSALKEKTEHLQREADKAAGVLESTMAKLKEDFDCDTLEEAEELLSKLDEEAGAAGVKYTKELKKFKDEFGELLNGV